MAFELDTERDVVVSIKVIGVGGGGSNAVNRMITTGVRGVEFIAVNTDRQALRISNATYKVQVGEKQTKGLGAGSDPEVGRKAAEESRDALKKVLEGADMVFITAGMGGGTGTGGAPIVADMAREMGILTVGVVTKPFAFEGKMRSKQAAEGIAELQERVDSLIVIPNERLSLVSEQKITFLNAFAIADDVLRQAIQSVSELINGGGEINLDFADVKMVMRDAGYAHMGVGHAAGKDKANEAARMAIESPLLETSISGAQGVIINITGSPDVSLEEVSTACEMIHAVAHPEARIIFGFAVDPNLDDEIQVTVIATGGEANKAALKGNTAAGIVDRLGAAGAAGNAIEDEDDDPFAAITKIFENNK